jgi:hypothetical protein
VKLLVVLCQIIYVPIKFVNSPIRPYPCDLCELRFYKKNQAVQHEQSVHEKISDRHKCQYCSFITHHSRMFYRHVKQCESKNKAEIAIKCALSKNLIHPDYAPKVLNKTIVES